MKEASVRVPEMVRRKAVARGEEGVAWLAGLGGVVRDLAIEWELSIGRTFSGGTEAFVAQATTAQGWAAILKIAIPGLDPGAGELRTLLVAQGRGYARVFRHDEARGAMLLERLGPRLDELGLPVDSQIEAICATLLDAWAPLPEGARFITGAEKASSLADYVETAWRDLGEPCSERTIDVACRFAERRRRAFDPASAVLTHGDARAEHVGRARNGARRFKFVDPDGLFIERAYDLGIPMREWSAELLAGDPLLLGARRCRRLARLTGVEPEPIWQWGFIERTSTGLLLLKVGLDRLGRELLAVADAWARADPSAMASGSG